MQVLRHVRRQPFNIGGCGSFACFWRLFLFLQFRQVFHQEHQTHHVYLYAQSNELSVCPFWKFMTTYARRNLECRNVSDRQVSDTKSARQRKTTFMQKSTVRWRRIQTRVECTNRFQLALAPFTYGRHVSPVSDVRFCFSQGVVT